MRTSAANVLKPASISRAYGAIQILLLVRVAHYLRRFSLLLQKDFKSSMVCVNVSLWYRSEPCKNSRADLDDVWVEDLGGPKEPCIR